MSARKINQILDQEGGCTLEQLLNEDDFCIQQCKQSHPKLMDFICQRANLEKLIEYATIMPKEESHDVAHKYPFAAMEVLCSSKQIASALVQGGQTPEPDSEGDEVNISENRMVREILGRSNVSSLKILLTKF